MYLVECLDCEYYTEVEALSDVFRVEKEHQEEVGAFHTVKWENERTGGPFDVTEEATD